MLPGVYTVGLTDVHFDPRVDHGWEGSQNLSESDKTVNNGQKLSETPYNPLG